MNFVKANELIRHAKTIAIVGHVRPDGDAIGSALALSYYKKADVFFDGGLSNQFDYLDGFKDIKTRLAEMKPSYDLLIIVDLNQLERLGLFQALIKRADKILCFDHHIGFNLNCEVAVADDSYASCGEIIFEVFKSQKIKITKQIANALYTAISTDTGRFLYPSTTPKTHLIAAALVEHGANTELINYRNFRVFDMKLIVGLKQIIRNLKFYKRGQISISLLKKGNRYDEAERTKFKSYVSDIRGVRVGVIITQEFGNTFQVSLRSHGDLDVEIPARALGGGGHKNAAGFTISGKYRKVVKRIIAEVEKLL
jgi:phosphoesterase RecJ-like protein